MPKWIEQSINDISRLKNESLSLEKRLKEIKLEMQDIIPRLNSVEALNYIYWNLLEINGTPIQTRLTQLNSNIIPLYSGYS